MHFSQCRFGRECYLDFDKEVTCRCPMGYEGRRCDQCAPGYSGNPTLPGDFCKPGKKTPKVNIRNRFFRELNFVNKFRVTTF